MHYNFVFGLPHFFCVRMSIHKTAAATNNSSDIEINIRKAEIGTRILPFVLYYLVRKKRKLYKCRVPFSYFYVT